MTDLLQINDIVDDRYKIISVLGEGGMAIVYKVHDLITDKDAALKIMRPETAIDKTNLSRFEREARAAASLNHTNIVRVNNLGTYKELPYMVNELITGQTLRQILDIRGKFSFIEALDIMEQLCRAVYYAHQHGVIHRDIKPQNIFLSSDGTIKLGDFGIATFQNANHVTRSEIVIGSVHYMAPEISQGSPASERSDIYSLGITFFELITGKVPYDSESAVTVALMHIKDKFPSIKKYNPKTPECIEDIILKACAKDPVERYYSAEDMRLDIHNILTNKELLTKKRSFFAKLFRRNKSSNKIEKQQKKSIKKAAKEAEKVNKDNGK